MKFRKPERNYHAVMTFYDSLPDEFEILGRGEVAVKWPEELTKDVLQKRLVEMSVMLSEGRGAIALYNASYGFLSDLAAIAPERKRRRVNLWLHKEWSADACPVTAFEDINFDTSIGWRKVAGPIEIED